MRGARRRRIAAALLALAVLGAGCTYEDREAGLFGRTPEAVHDPSESPPSPPDSVGPIPLLGEATWVSADSRGIPVRIAVHGVRRVPGGTVLDWSITALSGSGRVPGEPVGRGLSLGLHEEANVALVDLPAGRVYRPLTTKRSGSRGCPCTPVSLAEQELEYDVPRLLQVVYPVLPAATRVVDVSIMLAPAFNRVPVAPLGQLSAPINETDLAAPVEAPPPLSRTEFSAPRGQRFAIEVNAVLAGGTLTSVVWTLESLTRGGGPEPGLQPALTRNGAWRVEPLRIQPAGKDAEAGCLCSDPAWWRDHLRPAGRRVTVVTTLGEIPRGVTTVDVLFPNVPPLTGISVRPASDASFRSAGTAPGPRRTWALQPDRPRSGWALSSWPTPTPVIPRGWFTPTVDRIRK